MSFSTENTDYQTDIYLSTIDYYDQSPTSDINSGGGSSSLVDPVHIAIYLTIGVIGIIGNGFTLLILCSSPSIRNKTFNMFLISQSLLDFISAVFICATAWDASYELKSGHFGIAKILRCYLWHSKHQVWGFLICSTYNLLCINIERWLSIRHTVFHKTSFLKKHALIMIVSVWVLCLIYNSASIIPTSRISDGVCIHNIWPNRFWETFVSILNSIMAFFFPFSVIVVLNLSIFLHLRKMALSGPIGESTSHQTNKMDTAKQNVLKTMIAITTLFFLCWVCNMTWYLLFSVGVSVVSASTDFYNFSVFMLNINCCVNPFCYAVQYREFQSQVRKLFCTRRNNRQSEPSVPSISTTTTST